MNKAVIIVLVLFTTNVFAQKEKRIAPPQPPTKFSSNKNIYYKPISFEKRLQKFPFNNSTKIVLISFNLDLDEDDKLLPLIPINSNIKQQEKSIKKIELSELVATKQLIGINQSKKLTLNQICKLTDILYNTCSKLNYYTISKLGCYNPRNAILFYNEADEIFEYLEICFECREFLTKPQKQEELEEQCSQVFIELKKFFEENNIETEKHKK